MTRQPLRIVHHCVSCPVDLACPTDIITGNLRQDLVWAIGRFIGIDAKVSPDKSFTLNYDHLVQLPYVSTAAQVHENEKKLESHLLGVFMKLT
jgi:hypothetical protein